MLVPLTAVLRVQYSTQAAGLWQDCPGSGTAAGEEPASPRDQGYREYETKLLLPSAPSAQAQAQRDPKVRGDTNEIWGSPQPMLE